MAIDYTENCFQQAEKIEDIELMAPIAVELCTSYSQAGKHLKVVEVVPKILAMLERTQREHDFFGTRYNVYSGLCGYSGLSSAMLGDFEQGKAFLDKGLHFALDINKPYGLGWLEFCYGIVFWIMWDARNSIEHLKKSIEYLEEAQSPLMLGLTWAMLGYGYHLMGEVETANKYIEKGFRIHRNAGLPYCLSYLFLLQGMVNFDSDHLKSAQNNVEEALTLSQDKQERHIEAISKIWLGRILGKTETSTPRGKEYILRGIEILEELKLRPYQAQGYLFLGEHYADRGQKEEALENLKKAKEMSQKLGMEYWLAKTGGILEGL